MNDKDKCNLLFGKMNRILKYYKSPYSRKHYLYPRLKILMRVFDESRYTNPEYYTELANLTKKINFDCDFKNGKCKKYRNYNNKKIMCCCSGCVWNFGYLKTRFIRGEDEIKNIEKEMLYYATKFSRVNGFWRRNKGCILPREKRSPTCLTHNCGVKYNSHIRLLFSTLSDARHGKFPNSIKAIISILKDHFLNK